MTTEPIYLDHNATTPVAPEVADAMEPFLRDHFGNPSSSHALGRRARAAVDEARAEVARLIGATPDEIVFTSGGSEADNMAVFGVVAARAPGRRGVVTSAVEHPAVLEPCRVLERQGTPLTVLGVDPAGRLDLAAAADAIGPGTALVSVMHANNEVGTIQPIAELAELCRDRGAWLHTDAAQSVGKVPVDVETLGVDLLTVAAHKLYGPKGIGALYVRRGHEIPRLIHGAGHERGRRAGTENVLAIVGLGAAARLARAELDDRVAHARAMRDRLRARLGERFGDLVVHGDPERGLPNTLSVALPGVRAADLLAALGDQVAASPGAACHADGIAVSSVLTAMDVPLDVATGTVRLSVGRTTTGTDVDRAAAVIAAAVEAG
ncbi:aminotransferase class V-fold PLP-dependent enzyme [bacterium]|nr:aminotransferase class V-fold PLP-dependent enzyme [bacterium]